MQPTKFIQQLTGQPCHRLIKSVFPFGKFGDEITRLVPFFRIFRRRDQGGVGRCTGRGQRASRPPDMERRDVAVANILLPRRLDADLFHRERLFNKPLICHKFMIPSILSGCNPKNKSAYGNANALSPKCFCGKIITFLRS